MSKRIISIVAIVALVAILGVCLIACNEETYAKRLEKAGYTVHVMTDKDIAELTDGEVFDIDIKWGVAGTKGTDYVVVICFADKEQAEAFATIYNMASGVFGGVKVETKGKILIAGTSEEAVKDAK